MGDLKYTFAANILHYQHSFQQTDSLWIDSRANLQIIKSSYSHCYNIMYRDIISNRLALEIDI